MNIMWICMDPRGAVASGKTPQEAFEEYDDNIGVSPAERCTYYKLDTDKPASVRMVITEAE